MLTKSTNYRETAMPWHPCLVHVGLERGRGMCTPARTLQLLIFVVDESDGTTSPSEGSLLCFVLGYHMAQAFNEGWGGVGGSFPEATHWWSFDTIGWVFLWLQCSLSWKFGLWEQWHCWPWICCLDKVKMDLQCAEGFCSSCACSFFCWIWNC